MTRKRTLLPTVLIPLVAGIALTPKVANGQIVPDDTLGKESSTVRQDVVKDIDSDIIEGGATRGANLFHSFTEFNVDAGRGAYFANPDTIDNILSRVTGSNISQILGTLGVLGDANLFLINPNGIVFGENARLDVNGSFFASTADSLLFANGFEFSGSNPEAPPLLTVNIPVGLGFRDNPGDIINKSVRENVGLRVPKEKTLALIGGDVSFEGGIIKSPGVRVELGGLTSTGTITISDDGSLNFPNDLAKANVLLTDNALVDITSGGGGSITVNANNLELTGASLLLAGIGEGLGSKNAVAGTIKIDATTLFADNDSQIRSDNAGAGKAGTINITTDTLDFKDGSAIVVSTFGQGDAGKVNITAQDISFDREWGGVYSTVGLRRIETDEQAVDAEGKGGKIHIDTDTLSLTKGARISVNSIAKGNAGNINISVTGEVSFIGQGDTFIKDFDSPVISSTSSQVQREGVGNSGNVNIEAGSLTLIDRGAVLVDNSGKKGNAGDIKIDVQDKIFLDRGALILSQIQLGAEGKGGDINISAGSLEAISGDSPDTKDDSLISADTKGIGNSGDINIDVEKNISLSKNRTAILTEVGKEAIGNAGNLTITANSLNVTNGARIESKTLGKGNAGNINININNATSLENGALITSQVGNNAMGNGGDISLTSAELNLTNRSLISADNLGRSIDENNISSAGDIHINVAGDINLDNNNNIQAQVRGDAVGNAGDIDINVDGSLFSTRGNFILADSQAKGDGGNITVTVGERIVLEGLQESGFPSQIVASLKKSAEGKSGNITINASQLILKDTAFIEASNTSTSIGSPGKITINVDSLHLSENAFINAFTSNDFDGDEITIKAQTLDLFSGGKIIAATNGKGNAGNINLNIEDQINVDNSVLSSANFVDFGSNLQLLNDLQSSPSGIYANASNNTSDSSVSSSVALDSVGNAGNIDITAQSLFLNDEARFAVNSEGTGNGGSIFLTADNLTLNNNSEISAATASGEGGNIALAIANILVLENNSTITAEAQNDGNGGNIDIAADFTILKESEIIANAFKGAGGNINITTQGLFRDRNSNISASSEFGLDGVVKLNTPDIDPSQGVVELPVNVQDPNKLIAQDACKQGIGSSLVVTGRGGLPPTANQNFNSNWVDVDLLQPIPPEDQSSLESDREANSVSPADAASQDRLIPAEGWVRNEKGEIFLVAYKSGNANSQRQHNIRRCQPK